MNQEEVQAWLRSTPEVDTGKQIVRSLQREVRALQREVDDLRYLYGASRGEPHIGVEPSEPDVGAAFRRVEQYVRRVARRDFS